jgi:tetratricopeptide (TPR) repeat protein
MFSTESNEGNKPNTKIEMESTPINDPKNKKHNFYSIKSKISSFFLNPVIPVIISLLSFSISFCIFALNRCDKNQNNKIALERILNEARDNLAIDKFGLREYGSEIWGNPSRKNIDLARQKWKEASILDPGNPKVIKLEADILSFSGKEEEAIRKYKEALELNPFFVSAYNGIGCSYRGMSMLQDSILAFEKAIELDPKNNLILGNLGFSLLLSEKHEESINTFKKALEIEPEHAKILSMLGGAFLHAGKTTEALEALKKAILIDKNEISAHQNLGLLYLHLKQYENALISLEIAKNLDDPNATIYAFIGFCLHHLNRKKEALINYETAMYLDSYNYKNLENLAILYRELGRINDADVLINKAAKIKAESINKAKFKIKGNTAYFFELNIPQK